MTTTVVRESTAPTNRRTDDAFLAGLAVAFGLVIVACHIESGLGRWQAAAWRYAAGVPGSPATWGVVILAGGIALAYGQCRDSARALRLGHRLVFWWFTFLCAAALLAMGHDLSDGTRQANPIAPLAWFGFAYLYRSRWKQLR